ncbi:MAG: phosphoglucosamine mutase, partial [Clostridiales bacterium]|nr:phosphoglucosamine mutase [Clostridiales bacterium]
RAAAGEAPHEDLILDGAAEMPVNTGGDVGTVTYCRRAVDDYCAHVIATSDLRFDGLEIALDCANGSASVSAEKIFTALGAKVHMLSDKPDGVNINAGCGSTHMEALQAYVKEHGLSIGFAFDGDADRMLAVDENGEVVDGDRIIAACAMQMKAEGRLKKNTAVVTVMSNMGFFQFCKDNGIVCKKTAVGDRYVLERMLRDGFNIGGEQSGHIIFLDYATTGDGQLSAVQLLHAVSKSGVAFSELSKRMEVFPQVLINVPVANENKANYNNDEEIIAAEQRAEMELMGEGRVLVRVSGTEPLVRVMLEGRSLELITRLGHEIAGVVKERLS